MLSLLFFLLAAGDSASASLMVSATVVSSCAVATTPAGAIYRCTGAAVGLVRVSGRDVRPPDVRPAGAVHTAVTGSLVTIDF